MENSDHETENTNNNSSCSACKYQRKKCKPDCILRKHFPANKFDQFKNVQKIFGIANITKMIKGANNSREVEGEIVESLCWEAESWARDPVRGPYGLFKVQEQELNELRNKQQIMQALIGTNSISNGNMMNVNYSNNGDLYMDSYASSYANISSNGSLVVQSRFLQRGGNGLVNNQGLMEHGNWRELQGNGTGQWRELQGMGNFGTERNTAGAANQNFNSKKPN